MLSWSEIGGTILMPWLGRSFDNQGEEMKRWKEWGHKCHVGLIVGEFRKLKFLFFFHTPCLVQQVLVKHYWENIWRLVLCSICWYFWSWLSYADPKCSSLSNNSIKLKKSQWLNPVPYVTAEALDKLRWQIHSWESQKLHFVWCSTGSCHSELYLTLVKNTVEGFQHKYKLKVKKSRDSESENSRAASKAAATPV